MRRINIFITQQQYDRLKKIVKMSGIKMAELIRRAIDKYLKGEE